MSTRAGLYVRISDDREGAGLGVARQEQDCRRLVETRGWHVQEVYVDNDVSAYSGKRRPAYERMLSDLQDGMVDVVVAWHTDRLHRSPIELEAYIAACEQRNVPTVTVTAGDLDLTTPSGRMVARMLGAAARHEVEHKSQRQRAKALQLAQDGRVGNGGHRPYGYAADRMTLVSEEAEQLRWAYAEVLAGRSLRSIAHDLTDRGCLTTTGRPWTIQALRYNLLTGRNAGLREHHRQVVSDAVWPAVVDRETWERTRAVLLDGGRLASPRDGTPFPAGRKYLLSGFLTCGRCGGKLRPLRSNRTQRFGCKPTRDGGCGGILVRYEPAEDFVVELLLNRLEQQADLQHEAPPDRTAHLLAAIASEERRLDELAAAFADDADANPLELRAAGSRIRRRIAESRAEIAAGTLQQAHHLLADPLAVRQSWLSGDYDLSQQRGVLATALERIDVGPAQPGNRFQPARLKMHWR